MYILKFPSIAKSRILNHLQFHHQQARPMSSDCSPLIPQIINLSFPSNNLQNAPSAARERGCNFLVHSKNVPQKSSSLGA